MKSRAYDDTGKIVKNSPGKSPVEMSPRKYNRINAEKGIHWSEAGDRRNDDDFEHYPLPLKKKNESLQMRNKKRGDMSKDELMNKFDRN